MGRQRKATGKDRPGRRDFLKLAGVGTVAGGTALLAGTSAKAAAPDAPDSQGYRKTEHVKQYYDLAKF